MHIKQNNKIEYLVERALDRLYKNDHYLIEYKPFDSHEKNGSHHVGERAIVFHLARYMLEIMHEDVFFDDYSLDCEYNRNMHEAKVIPSNPHGVYPDVIIHKRGRNDGNWAIFEIKTYWNKNQSFDQAKIRDFLDENGDYQYEHGVLIRLEKNRSEVDVRYFNS